MSSIRWGSFSLPFQLASLLLTYCILLTSPVLTSTHPSKATTCHGPIPGVRYSYEYNTELILNNDDGHEPAGFQAQVYFSHENLWQNAESYLSLFAVESIQFKPRSVVRGYRFPDGPTLANFPAVLVQHSGTSGSVENLFVPKSTQKHQTGHLLEPTHMNIIVALLNALRSRFPDQVSFCLCFDLSLI